LLSYDLSHMAKREYLYAGSQERLNIIWVSGIVVKDLTFIGKILVLLLLILFGIFAAYLIKSSISPKLSNNSIPYGFTLFPKYLYNFLLFNPFSFVD